jgi:hypothetical protein
MKRFGSLPVLENWQCSTLANSILRQAPLVYMPHRYKLMQVVLALYGSLRANPQQICHVQCFLVA